MLTINIEAARAAGFTNIIVTTGDEIYDELATHVFGFLNARSRDSTVRILKEESPLEAGESVVRRFPKEVYSLLAARPVLGNIGAFALATAHELHAVDSYRRVLHFLKNSKTSHGLVTFPVAETLLGSHPVRRSLCSWHWSGAVMGLEEGTVHHTADGLVWEQHGRTRELRGDEPAAMNLWAIRTSMLDELAVLAGTDRLTDSPAREMPLSLLLLSTQSSGVVEAIVSDHRCLSLEEETDVSQLMGALVDWPIGSGTWGEGSPALPVLKVTVVQDWSRCGRAVLWRNVLEPLSGSPKLGFELEIQYCSPAEELWRAGADFSQAAFAAQEFSSADVMVVNWDAANGDPEFGSDLTMRWFEHRRLEILHWVARRKHSCD